MVADNEVRFVTFFTSDIEIIFKDTFLILRLIGILFFVPVIVSIIYDEYYAIPFFALTGFVLILLGFRISGTIKGGYLHTQKMTDLKHAMIVVSLVWLLTAFFSSFPFMFIMKMSFLDSFFEAMSAWTTTGFSMFRNVESAPYTIIFWRSFMQWIGGIGIVVAVVQGVIRMGGSLFNAEGREEKIQPHILHTIRTIWWIYLLYTAVGISLLVLAGMPVFDAIIHTMSGLSTGGMGNKNMSIAAYDSFAIEIILMLIMIAGSISFLTHNELLRMKFKEVKKDFQAQYFILIIFIAAVILMGFIPSARHIAFQAVSAATGTGYSTTDISKWSEFPKAVLIMLMIFGGCAGSTAGGMKIMRVVVFFKSMIWYVKSLANPNMVIEERIGNKSFSETEIKKILLFMHAYLFFILIGTSVIMTLGYSSIDSLFEVASAQGNVGLSTGIVNTELAFLGKLMLIINMLVGRLEIWAVLVLLSSIVFRR